MKKLKSILLAAVLTVAPSGITAAAQEQHSGVYVQPEVGLAKSKGCPGEIQPSFTTTSCDSTGYGIGLSGGYWFNDHLAGEVGFLYADGFSASAGSSNISTETNSTHILFGGRFRTSVDVGPFLTGRVGWHFSEVKDKCTPGRTSRCFGTTNRSKSANNPYFGLGAGYNFTEDAGLSLEYTRFTGDDNINFFSASFVWKL